MVTPVVTVFLQGLSRSAAATIELQGNTFGGIVVCYRFSAYNHLPVMQRQLCWAHLIRDLIAIAERSRSEAGEDECDQKIHRRSRLLNLDVSWQSSASRQNIPRPTSS